MSKKNLIIFTDAYEPQVNGVVTTLKQTKKHLERMNYTVIMISPNDFRFTTPLPFYNQIRLAFPTKRTIHKIIKRINPDYIHIATEGPIGYQASRVCQKKKITYTTSYHTNFPEYINQKIPFISERMVNKYLRTIHYAASRVLATTSSMEKKLYDNGISRNISVWGRGVDTSSFRFSNKINDYRKIRLLYVGRISDEKNIESFLDIEQKFFVPKLEKIVVGDGPSLKKLQKQYAGDKSIKFLGCKKGEDLEKEYQSADVFVFPSKTDTFGIVMLESMACGTPVAGYRVMGPKDIIIPGVNGYIDDNLTIAVLKCIHMDRKKCANSVSFLTWEEITANFKTTIEYANENKFSLT